ncbi:MAG: diguanylate cyclase, partial [Proteobacteria bacterium]|nr:diguanylate cyclase [Pseudomonadota bacterium]
ASNVQTFLRRGTALLPLPPAGELPAFRGTHDLVFLLPDGISAQEPLYLQVNAIGPGWSELRPTFSTLAQALARRADHTRIMALAFGALTAMATAALLIWLILKDRLFMLYAGLFFLQGLYLVYLSGEGFDWPWLSLATPLGSHAWNVPAGLSGAISCLFVREIAELKRSSPRAYATFGWLAVVFVSITLANAAKFIGLGALVNAIGNVVFLFTSAFTLMVTLLAWRRGNRAAGWFLLAWILLAASTITTSAFLLAHATEEAGYALYYFALPLSMVVAAVLLALGVADHLREQRLALSEARRHAQIDPLTGVLNRRSLIEHLDAACLRARARGLPIAILFIDLDHFKLINDSFGHQAGDACLRGIIEPIQAELRQSDVIGRWGGEEFVVMLSSADASAAQPIAERIRRRVQDTVIDGYGASINLTCSIGLAASDAAGLWGEALIAQADAAVYAAKRAGRNQVYPAAVQRQDQ